MEVETQLRNDLERTRKTRFDHKMTIDKDAKFEETLTARHEQEVKLTEELIQKKEEEEKKLIKEQ